MLVILVGKSGVGKTSIIKRLQCKCKFIYPPSYTTRPRRQINDDKIRITYTEFNECVDEFIEYVYYNGNYYGRKKEDILQAKEIDLIIDLEPKGLSTYINFCKHNSIPYHTIYLHCDECIRITNIQEDNGNESRIYRNDEYFDTYFNINCYDIIINTHRFTIEQITQLIVGCCYHEK